MSKYNNNNAQANNDKEALRAELVTTITIKGMAPGETITLSDDGRIKVELKKFRERREAVEAVTLQDLMG